MFEDIKTILLAFLFISSQLLIVIPAQSLSTDKIEAIINQDIKTETIPSDLLEIIQKVDESKLRTLIQNIQDFGPHPTGSEAINRIGEYLYNELKSTKLPVEYIDWTSKKHNGRNIEATLKGTGETEGAMILCAHYDSISISPGADDDGSGVAVVIAIADIMRDYSFNTTIKFILFSGEEQGKQGSSSYAKNAKNNGENILGVIALDKIGYAQTAEEGGKIVHHSNIQSSWMVDVSKKITEEYQDAIQLEVLDWSEDPASDHMAFVEQGYCGTDFVRYAVNPFYHTSEDILEHMNITYLAKVCKLVAATIARIAEIKPALKNDDLKITVKGSSLSKPSQIYIKIENKGYKTDTANVTINISLKHLFRDKYVSTVKEHYSVPCAWNMTKEIGEFWEFLVGGHTFTRGLFKLDVEINGINDDIYLYKKEITYGFIFNKLIVRMMPIL